MQSESSPIKIALTPRFKKDLRELAKRYRSIRSDIQPLIEQLQAGEIPQDVELLELNIRFSKFVSKIAIFKKEKVEAIE